MVQNAPVLKRLRERKEWTFFAVLPKASGPIAIAWWTLLLLRGVLPAVFGIAMGMLIGAVQRGDALVVPLTVVGAVFVLLQIMTPLHQAVSTNLGDRTAAWLYDRLTDACVRPPGMGHLEDPALTSDLIVARDFDLGMTGPPLSISMDFIAADMVETDRRISPARSSCSRTPGGHRSCWPAHGWRPTGCFARAAVWQDRNTDDVRAAQRDADYAYRLAVDAPASKELRLFGLADWTIDRFVAAPHPSARSAVRGDTPARAADAVERRCWSSSPTSWCSGRWRAPPPTGRITLGQAVVVRPERRRACR